MIRMLEIFMLFAFSKKTQKLQACENWEVSYVYQSIWRLMRKLQARELPGWTMLRILGILQCCPFPFYHHS